MITQAVLDFVRDFLLNWVSGFGSIAAGMGAGAAGSAVGAVAAQAGRLLALFIAPSVWPSILVAFGVFLLVWLSTGVIAIFARRNTSS